jgi:serine/threonine-protein phosphatase 2B catalytic subunit
MTTEMDFRRQTCYHYDEDLYEKFMELFDTLPLSAIVNGRDICMHGGLSPELKSLDQI